MPQQLNTSEEFVHWVCLQSFLSLWSYASPRGKKGKELCDILVVCEPDVIIISVKDIRFNEGTDVAHARWTQRAIDESVKQIYGAERWVAAATNVVRIDGTTGLSIPELENRRIHRIAVAFGSEGKVAFRTGDFGKGFVHVFDERSFGILLSELDTISDFVAYLAEKEQFTSHACVVFEGEENLLALYLRGGRRFPVGPDFCIVQADLWDTFAATPKFNRRNDANRESYSWDRVIELVASDILNANLEVGPDLIESELGIRVMAREDRFCRRVLGRNFLEFVRDARAQKTRARLMQSPSGVSYVLFRMPPGEDRQKHLPELKVRCFVARGLSAGSSTVIGIGVSDVGEGWAITVLYYDHPQWTAADAAHANKLQDELDIFPSSRSRRVPEEEYTEKPSCG